MARAKDEMYEVLEDSPANVSLADLVRALQALKGSDDETLKKRAQYEAEAHVRLTKRENETHPGISVFNPQGERDHPKPELKCRMFWVGFPLEKDALTPTEIALLNQVEEVGKFSFTRTDGSPDTMVIEGERDANGDWAKLEFIFPARGDKKNNLPSMVSMLREVLGLGTVEAALLKRVAELEAALKTA